MRTGTMAMAVAALAALAAVPAAAQRQGVLHGPAQGMGGGTARGGPDAVPTVQQGGPADRTVDGHGFGLPPIGAQQGPAPGAGIDPPPGPPPAVLGPPAGSGQAYPDGPH